MSGPFFSGYDAWKTREPDYDCDTPLCECCGEPKEMARGLYVAWICERCDEEPLPGEPDYDAWAEDGP